MRAPDLFTFDKHGHFGDKVQYNSSPRSSDGAVFIIHLRKGDAFLVEVKYPESGVVREHALKDMKSLLMGLCEAAEYHDEDDIKLGDCKECSEFFYFDKGKFMAELRYLPDSRDLVRQLDMRVLSGK